MLTLFGEVEGTETVPVDIKVDRVSTHEGNRGESRGDHQRMQGVYYRHRMVPFLLRAGFVGLSNNSTDDPLEGLQLSGSFKINKMSLTERLALLRADFNAGIENNSRLFNEALEKVKNAGSSHPGGGSVSTSDKDTGLSGGVVQKGAITGPVIGEFGAYRVYDPRSIKVTGVVDIVGLLRPTAASVRFFYDKDRSRRGGPNPSYPSMTASESARYASYNFDVSIGRINSLILDQLANQTYDFGYGLNLNNILRLAKSYNLTGMTEVTDLINVVSLRAALYNDSQIGYIGGNVVGGGYVAYGGTVRYERNDYDRGDKYPTEFYELEYYEGVGPGSLIANYEKGKRVVAVEDPLVSPGLSAFMGKGVKLKPDWPQSGSPMFRQYYTGYSVPAGTVARPVNALKMPEYRTDGQLGSLIVVR